MEKLLSMKRRGARALTLAALAGLLLAGCGNPNPTGTVRGKVLLNDKPYTNAAVVFLSLKTGQGGSVDIQPDGSFSLPDPLPVGDYKVYLAPKSVPPTAAPQPVTIDQSVPDKYWNEASSDITIQVVEGENDVTVPLKK